MKSKKAALILAIVFGLITVFALNYYIRNVDKPVHQSSQQTSVVVARSTIPAHTRITAEMLETISLPSDAVHSETLRNMDDAVGAISRAEIIKGEQVMANRVFTDERRASISYRVPEGLRAVSIPVGEVTGVSGYISPGDKVDVLVAYTIFDSEGEYKDVLTVYTVVQNTMVLATGEFTQEVDNEERRLVSTATLAVTPEQAEVLAYANLEGTFHLTLRSPLDEEIVDLGYYNIENFDTFRER